MANALQIIFFSFEINYIFVNKIIYLTSINHIAEILGCKIEDILKAQMYIFSTTTKYYTRSTLYSK